MNVFFLSATLGLLLHSQPNKYVLPRVQVSAVSHDQSAARPLPIDTSRISKDYPIAYSSLRVRDPFILADKKSKHYYLAVNRNPSFKIYSSKDLKNWKDEGNGFTADPDFWGKTDFWAPDLIEYKGKYYIWGTFSGINGKRGTSIVVADKPTGPFKPLVNESLTPANWMTLDGTLYIDKKNKPWILYCHEWLEVGDGEVVAQQLSGDLKKTVGEPVILFKASEGSWTGPIGGGGKSGYVTDAPFIYKAKNGELLMLWSSFTKSGKYAIGVARSASGNVTGPWKQDAQPINDDDGGHAMIFKDFNGVLKISYHAPNSKAERPVIYSLKDEQGKLTILK